MNLIKLEKSISTELVLSEYFEMKEDATKLADLNLSQKTKLNMLIEKYKLALRVYTIKIDAFKLLNTYIITIVDRINMLQLTDMKTVY